MAWVHVVPEGVPGPAQAAYDRIRRQRGAIGNVVSVSSLIPEVMERGIDYYVALMYGSSKLSRARREMVAVETSRANRCDYCMHHHAAALERVTKDRPGFAARFMREGPHVVTDPRELALLAYARKLTLTPWDVTKADIDGLRRAGFGDEEICTAGHVVGYFNQMNRLVLGLGVDLEADKGADPAYHYG